MDKILLSQIPITELKEALLTEVLEQIKGLKITEPQQPEKLLTRKETAELLSVSLVSLHEWTKEGLLPAHRIGTRVRYKYSEVIESLNKIKTSKDFQ